MSRKNSSPSVILLAAVLAVAGTVVVVSAQTRSANATFYPERIYPGDNVITVTSQHGIERIVTGVTRYTTVDVPSISGCPKKVDVRVNVRRADASEAVEFTVFDCDGGFASHTIQAENWTIKPEFTGLVRLGHDTCLDCRIESTEGKLVDSIVVNDPRFRVQMPDGTEGPWQVTGGVDFHYRVCYRAERVDSIRQMIRLYMRRTYPNAGLTQYVIEKPITAIGVLPPPPKVPAKREPQLPMIPPLYDPTTFRNILMPTAESVGQGKAFVGTYDLAAWLVGYGLVDRVTVIAGGAFVPSFISRLLLGTVGVKYEAIRSDLLLGAVGYQYGYSSTVESDISASTPYAVLSFGDREQRISVAAAYTWKHHTTPRESFDRNAAVVAIGGDLTIARGWKIAAETYFIQSAGIAPVAFTVRRFGEHFAVDAGLGIDAAHAATVQGTTAFAGEIRDLRLAPVLSAIWVW